MGDAREKTRATRGGGARMTPARRRPRKMRATRGERPGGTRTTGRPAGADAGENPANDKNDKSFS